MTAALELHACYMILSHYVDASQVQVNEASDFGMIFPTCSSS